MPGNRARPVRRGAVGKGPVPLAPRRRPTLPFGGFGKGPTEKDPNHGHLAGGLFHSVGGHAEKDLELQAPRRVAYPAPYCLKPSLQKVEYGAYRKDA
jgi:hypothetical protein